MIQEFKEFAMRGSVVDMAVGIIMGSAFGTVVKSLVDDVLMPPLGLMLGGVDYSNVFVVLKEGIKPGPYLALTQAKAAGAVTINVGVFLNNVISFLIVAFSAFLLIRGINALRRAEKTPEPSPGTKECEFCAMRVSLKARRCPHCTSELVSGLQGQPIPAP